jgi:hypothetical protein
LLEFRWICTDSLPRNPTQRKEKECIPFQDIEFQKRLCNFIPGENLIGTKFCATIEPTLINSDQDFSKMFVPNPYQVRTISH